MAVEFSRGGLAMRNHQLCRILAASSVVTLLAISNAHPRCGVARWDVKIGRDSEAKSLTRRNIRRRNGEMGRPAKVERMASYEQEATCGPQSPTASGIRRAVPGRFWVARASIPRFRAAERRHFEAFPRPQAAFHRQDFGPRNAVSEVTNCPPFA